MALCEHVHRKNACDPLKSNVTAEELQAMPQYPKPKLHKCADCNREFGRRALHDHTTNKSCPVVKAREAAAAAAAVATTTKPSIVGVGSLQHFLCRDRVHVPWLDAAVTGNIAGVGSVQPFLRRDRVHSMYPGLMQQLPAILLVTIVWYVVAALSNRRVWKRR
jgi:hypothetical protein